MKHALFGCLAAFAVVAVCGLARADGGKSTVSEGFALNTGSVPVSVAPDVLDARGFTVSDPFELDCSPRTPFVLIIR